MCWLTGLGGSGKVDRDQILRLLGEREAAGRVEVVRLEQEAARIGELIEECRREVERMAIAREALSGLVAEPAGAAPAGRDLKPDAVFADQLLAVLAEVGGPVRCRDVVAALGEDLLVARHGERVRHRPKTLVIATLPPGFAPVDRPRSTRSFRLPGQIDRLGQPHHRHQPGARHQIRLFEDRVRRLGTMQQFHLTGALSNRLMVV
jgi:hypothetical protein